MIAQLQAVRAHLGPLNYPVHLFQVTQTNGEQYPDGEVPNDLPYLILQVPGHTPIPVGDRSISGVPDWQEFLFAVTAVTDVPDAPPKVLERVKDRLVPGGVPTKLPHQGWSTWVSYEGTETYSTTDRDLFVTATNMHPSWGVATYRLVSQPL